MPQVTVYVREDDLAAWKALPKKSEWISHHLNNQTSLVEVERQEPKAPPEPTVELDEGSRERTPEEQAKLDAYFKKRNVFKAGETFEELDAMP